MFHTENVFERTNGTLNSSSSGVEVSPIRRTTQDARIETQVTVRVDVNTAAILDEVQGLGQVQRKEQREAVLWTTDFGQTNFERFERFFHCKHCEISTVFHHGDKSGMPDSSRRVLCLLAALRQFMGITALVKLDSFKRAQYVS